MKFTDLFKFVYKHKDIFLPTVVIFLIFLLINYFMTGNSLTPIGYNIF
jgi:hypothetical protein